MQFTSKADNISPMRAEKRERFALIIPQEEITHGDGKITTIGKVLASDQEAAEMGAQSLAEKIGKPVTLMNSNNPRGTKTFGMSSAFDNGNCEYNPPGPRPNWEIKPRTEEPKDPRVN